MGRNDETITLHTDTRYRKEPIVVPLHSASHFEIRREKGEIPLIGQVVIGAPLGVIILLMTDGTWQHWQTIWDAGNHYYHFYLDWTVGTPGKDFEIVKTPPFPPTEEQRRTIARWFFAGESPYQIPLGGPVKVWAFAGMTDAELSERYGPFEKMYYA